MNGNALQTSDTTFDSIDSENYSITVLNKVSEASNNPTFSEPPTADATLDFQLKLKRVFDIVAASIVLVMLSPIIVLLFFIICLDGGSPVFSHTRIGKNGRKFGCLKFRSMAPNAAELLKDLLAADPDARAEWEKDFKLRNDPRITKIGGFLRRTSLDELPQLLNVIKGEMSLVGPRPIVDDEIEYYGSKYIFYRSVTPGITGFWQISGRNDVSYENRVKLDETYVRNWSFWFDLKILFKTIPVFVMGSRGGAY